MKTPWSGHYRPRFPIGIICQWCGNSFTAYRQDAKFCKAKCRKAMSRAVNKSLKEQ